MLYPRRRDGLHQHQPVTKRTGGSENTGYNPKTHRTPKRSYLPALSFGVVEVRAYGGHRAYAVTDGNGRRFPVWNARGRAVPCSSRENAERTAAELSYTYGISVPSYVHHVTDNPKRTNKRFAPYQVREPRRVNIPKLDPITKRLMLGLFGGVVPMPPSHE